MDRDITHQMEIYTEQTPSLFSGTDRKRAGSCLDRIDRGALAAFLECLDRECQAYKFQSSNASTPHSEEAIHSPFDDPISSFSSSEKESQVNICLSPSSSFLRNAGVRRASMRRLTFLDFVFLPLIKPFQVLGGVAGCLLHIKLEFEAWLEKIDFEEILIRYKQKLIKLKQ